MQLEQSNQQEWNESGEIFTVSDQVSLPPTSQLNVDQTPPSRGKDSSLRRPKPRVLVGEVNFPSRSGQEIDAGSAQIVFGRERRPQVLHLLRQRTAALCVFLKQKFHTRTMNIHRFHTRTMNINQSPASTEPDVPPEIQPRLQTRTTTPHTTVSRSPLSAGRDVIPYNLNASRRLKTHSESTEIDKDDPVQYLVQR